MLSDDKFRVFGGTGHHGFDEHVLRLFNDITGHSLDFSHIWFKTFPDREPGFRFEKPNKIFGRHVVIFACPIDDRTENQLRDLTIACKRQYGAKSTIIVLSFLRYRRQDRSEKVPEITRLRWFIQNLRFWGADRLVVCEPHNGENTGRYCQEYGLELSIADPTPIFAQTIEATVRTLKLTNEVWLYGPDKGTARRALALAKALDLGVVISPKKREDGKVYSVDDPNLLAELRQELGSEISVSTDLSKLKASHVIMREDEVSTGSTSAQAAWRLRGPEIGATSIHLAATHPVCAPGWQDNLFPQGNSPAEEDDQKYPFNNIWLGNTRPRGPSGQSDYEESTGRRVAVVDVAPVIANTLAEVISRIKD